MTADLLGPSESKGVRCSVFPFPLYFPAITTTGFDVNPSAFADTSIFPALLAFTYATHSPRCARRSLF